MRKYTDAKKEGNRKWDAANLDRISIALPKGRKQEIQAEAERRGQSVNGFINRLIDAALSPGVPSTGTFGSPVAEHRPGVVMVSVGASPDKNNSSRSTSLATPDPQTAADRPYLPIPIWEDDSTPELEAKLVAILHKRNVLVPTVRQYESLSPEQQEQEKARLLSAREQARKLLDEYERRQKG